MPENNNSHHHHCLGELSSEDFLSQYWQQKPLLIRNAFPDIESPLSADELAGLACEESVNARLVLEKADDAGAHTGDSRSDRPSSDRPWRVEFGPFDESRFSELPASRWSLLVSDVEKHLPESASLLEAFHFIPDWRIDDLMISYAPPGGSVGAHTDAYDVFLIQLSGQRLWQISESFSDETLTGTDLSILKEFHPEQGWLLEAGDMLYLPPNVAHLGIAQTADEPCMTASVGFRAPSLKTICNEYVHYLSERFPEETRYRDDEPVTPAHHAEISEHTVDQFIDYLKRGLSLEREQIRCWLGEFCSDNKAFDDFMELKHSPDIDTLLKQENHSRLRQSSYAHFLFSHSEQGTLLFVNGNSYRTSTEFAECLCDQAMIDMSRLRATMTTDDQIVLLELYNNGAIIADR